MPQKPYSVLLISDFTIDVFSGYLQNEAGSPEVMTTAAPFGQVIPVLVDKTMECWKSKHDCAVVWTRPEAVVKTFGRLLDYQMVPTTDVLAEVEEYTKALKTLRDRVSTVFVPTWVYPTYHRGHGMLDMKAGTGLANTLMRMNLKLAEALDDTGNMHLLNTQKWIETVGKHAFSPKLWYMGKIPFANNVFKMAAHDVKAALRGLMGESKKLIVVDLDDTMWGGIVGDLGWENIRLGGHDPFGEAFVDFQKALKSFKNRGILLGIVSKNEESVALKAINSHPEMLLRTDDFAGWKINWENKAQNIVDLANELNLGLQSVVFIDDNRVERAWVRDNLPEVFVPEWPADVMLYAKTLLELDCFDTPSVSEEDLKRAEMYRIEKKRQDAKTPIGSLDDWLKTLEITVTVEKLNSANRQRTAQLFNKTNQMNLTTRRLAESELQQWKQEENRMLWTFRVADKFGDSGLTGIASLEIDGDTGRIVDFILSCRVFGRKIEETMVYTVIEYAKTTGLKSVTVRYLPTPKNKPCLEFWKRSGFNNNGDDTFTWDLEKPYCLPDQIKFEGDIFA